MAAAKKIDIVRIETDKLVEAEYNPRQLSEKQHEDLKKSIETFGFIDPIIINVNPKRKNYVVGGHQRLKIARLLNISKVPCVQLNLTEQQEKELNVRLNKNMGTWDWDKLANEFDVAELLDWGFTEKDLTAFDDNYDDSFELPSDEKSPYKQITFTLTDEQHEVVQAALKKAKENDFGDTGNDNSNGNAIWWICSCSDNFI